MARPLRIEYEHALYHVMARGHRKENIFFSDKDRSIFLLKLEESLIKYSAILYCYCLMNNHYHLLLETPHANLSALMHYFNASYTNYIKAKYSLVGSLFQGRFKAILVENDSYLSTLSAYIHLNPLRARLTQDLNLYPWSSYLFYINETPHPFLKKDLILNLLGSKSYETFTMEWYHKNMEIDKKEIYGTQGVLGSDQFKNRISELINKKIKTTEKNCLEYPGIKQWTSLSFQEIYTIFKNEFKTKDEDIFAKHSRSPYRKLLMWALKHHTDLKNTQIAELFHVHYTVIAKIDQNIQRSCSLDPKLDHSMTLFKKKLSDLKNNK
ncbi:MAG TPA: chromosomal replication initiator DnaA [Firmicutes bacterium]|nr:chromosomal replication initiator DnaA [Bacillota bacterium]